MSNYSRTDVLKNSDGLQTAADETEMYDKVLLCTICNPNLNNNITQEASKEKKELKQNESPTDLKGLLTQSAEAVASSDMKTADELIKKIRQHSSPYGDGTERLAHYFANAIEARLAGTGMALYTASTTKRVMAADTLKAYQAYITACPFHKMSYIFANKTIGKLASRTKSLHIIDFGISYGFQWPSLIQCLSMREGGPPRLRITGIDHPEPGRSPAERVEDSGRRLANYCQRFNVPFEYNAIVNKWENITIEDLKMDRGQMIVVNSLYRLGNVPDETVVASSPRDTVLNLVKRMDPDMFIHGVVNGTFNSPFFNTRFQDAISHFSAMFDILEATTERWDEGRMMFEREVFGREAMNIIAWEGEGRIERPETYKQWEDRNQRAGFKQMPLCGDIVKEVSEKVRLQYHKDFVVEEDSNWMLQGWKGQFIYALSCWKPVQD